MIDTSDCRPTVKSIRVLFAEGAVARARLRLERYRRSAGLVGVAGMALLAVLTAFGQPLQAQDFGCNADITVANVSFRLNPDAGNQPVVLTIKNQNAPGGNVVSFDKVYFRPNCREVDSSQPAGAEAACGAGGVVIYDDGFVPPIDVRPFSLPLPLSNFSTDCPGVEITEFYALGDPNALNLDGVEWLEFTFGVGGGDTPPNPTPGFLKLDPGQTCQVQFELQVENFPATFDPSLDEGDDLMPNTVFQIAGTEAACLATDNPDLPFDLPASAKDTAGPVFLNPTCEVEVDKQVSCDGGLTWSDVDFDLSDGTPDGVAAGCTGWTSPPPEIKVRYIARNNSRGNFFQGVPDNTMTSCELSDSNTAVLGMPVQVGDLPGFPNADDPNPLWQPAQGYLIHETDLVECNENLEGWLEPNTATLDCLCPATENPEGPAPKQVTDDANIDCQTPQLTVDKACVDQPLEQQGDYTYQVTVTNTGTATLDNCVLDDPSAVCTPLSTTGPLAPTEQATATCTSPEPTNTVTATCDIVGAVLPDGSLKRISDTDSAECPIGEVEVVKECASNNGDGTYTYDVKATNTGEADLVNCRLEDTNPVPASCTALSQTSLAPGDMATASCDSESDRNIAKVVCDIEGLFFPDGSPKTTTDESLDGCVTLDKRISCDGGQSFVDVGYNEPLAEACIGWSGTGPSAEEVVLQYAVRTGVAMTQCELADSNLAVLPAPVSLGSLPANFDAVVYETELLTCDFVDPGEPDTATVTCVSTESGRTVTDEDSADLECQEASVDLIKQCASNVGGVYSYDLIVTNNGEAHLSGCELVDQNPAPATCTGLSQTSLDPGDTATATCTSSSIMNMAQVTCVVTETACEDISLDGGTVVGPGAEEYSTCGDISISNYVVEDSGYLLLTGGTVILGGEFAVLDGGTLTVGNRVGSAKVVTDEATAGCLDLDKQISCDGGMTFVDIGYHDSIAESCTGWSGTGPGADEIVFRYLARAGSAMQDCVLTDTNGAVLSGPVPVAPLAAKFNGVVHIAPPPPEALFCDDVLPGEPDTATLTCVPLPDEPGDPIPPAVMDSDSADLECQDPPQLVVTKECRAEKDPQTGDFVYDVTISNTAALGAAPLTSCEVTDTTAVGCNRAAGEIGPIGGGQSVTITCTSTSESNTASVTCQGPKGPLTGQDSDECRLCDLEVVKTCEVVEPVSFDCQDAQPLDVLVMIWNGVENVDVTAWAGNPGSTIVGQVFGVMPGQEVRISGFASAGNDVVWEIFEAGTGNKLGESKFHLSCSDADMNGAEDCGEPQGDGSANEPGLINDWLLEGIEGNGRVLDCTADETPPSDTCVTSGGRTLCDKRLTMLSVRITGEDCTASSNTQDAGSWDCTDSLAIDPTQPVQVYADGPGPDPPYFNMVQVDVGDVLVLDPTAVGRTIIEGEMRFQIFQGGLAQEVRFHTSCSQDLATGDKFGGVQVWAFANPRQGTVQFGSEVVYEYKITNLSSVSAFDLSVIDDPDPGDPFTVPGSPIAELMPGEMVTLSSTRVLTETTTNEVTVSGALGSPTGQTCEATDDAVVTFETVLVTKECAPQDVTGDNAVTITLENVGDVDLVCEVSDPLANFLQSGVQLDMGAAVVLDATVSGLVVEELNTVTVECVEAQSGGQLPSVSASDVCELP